MPVIKWQDFLNVLTLKARDTGTLQEVQHSKQNIEKFKLCYNATKLYLEEWLEEQTKSETKSASKSTQLRLAGNKVYQRGDDLAALVIYNASVTVAPYDTNEFALAVANRSAVLNRLDYFYAAIQDIDLALQYDNNDNTKTKLIVRKAVLLNKLGFFEDTLEFIASLFPDEDQIYKQENVALKDAYLEALSKSKNVGKAFQQKSQNIKSKVLNEIAKSDKKIPFPKGGENKTFSSASAHVSLEFSKQKGRHVIATEDFSASDILFVEKPFALVVLPDQYKLYCHHCCSEILAYVPCRECTIAFFCSPDCRETAWIRYHQWECCGLDLCHSIGIAHLGFRVALHANDTPEYKKVFDLASHIDDMKADDIYQYAITAALLTIYLEKHTSYFENNTDVDVNEMGSRILRHIAQLVCNGHAIIKIHSPLVEEGCCATSTESQRRIATAIYPSASMMNHSCDQNISNTFVNEFLIVKASRPIKKGEEVFNCYGPHYKTMDVRERQRVLQSQYYFTCECKHCKEQKEQSDWKQFNALLCSYCTGPVFPEELDCSHCGLPQPIIELANLALNAQRAFHQGKILMNEGNIQKASLYFEESVKLSSKCLYKHHSDLRTYKDALARTYVELGEYNKSIALIEDCVVTIEKQFGCKSIELSRELVKLFDLIELELNRLTFCKLEKSEEFRDKRITLTSVTQKIKKISDDNVEAAMYVNSLPEIIAAFERADIK